MSQERILIVEDDKNIAQLVKYNLEKAGFDCRTMITGEDAMDFLETEAVDLIILDIMLPKMDGLETCRCIKQQKRLAGIPIMMLTAKGEEVDRIIGFELGADDYIVKPFSPREFVLRVKAILRRGVPQKEEGEEVLQVDNLILHVPRHEVRVGPKEVKLTAMEFKLLFILMKRKGRLQSRDQLLRDVWDLEADVTTRTVDTHIKCLRRKIGKAGVLIETVRGYGYRITTALS
jgi:DNA-binding response OmpR family regulator